MCYAHTHTQTHIESESTKTEHTWKTERKRDRKERNMNFPARFKLPLLQLLCSQHGMAAVLLSQHSAGHWRFDWLTAPDHL